MKIKIIKNEQIAEHAYKMSIAAPVIAKSSIPGQFVMVRTSDGYQPLLRRPFSVHSVGSRVKGQGSSLDILEILYEVVGEGTQILSQKKPGEHLDIIGPLGNGFNLNPGSLPLASILIAGGMGIAPFLFLAKKLKKPTVLIGAKTKSHILCEKEFKKLGCDVKIATDDGSRGRKGFVTDLLQDVIKCRGVLQYAPTIFACGPKPMLKAVAAIAARHNIPAQVSLEEYMACGIGACLGCIVNTKTGQKRVCKDGSIFSANEIIWE